MNKNKRKMMEGWIDKASNQLNVARKHLESSVRYSEAIEASQECIELSVKSILLLLSIGYTLRHGWEESKKEFTGIAEQISNRNIQEKLETEHIYIRLPRLLLLVNLWSHFYQLAKYGFTAGHLSPASDLFNRKEAELAIAHAAECYQAALQFRYLNEEKLDSIASQP